MSCHVWSGWDHSRCFILPLEVRDSMARASGRSKAPTARASIDRTRQCLVKKVDHTGADTPNIYGRAGVRPPHRDVPSDQRPGASACVRGTTHLSVPRRDVCTSI